MRYSSIFPQKNPWIGPVWGELIWHLSNECWWGIQARSSRANSGVWVSAGLFSTLKESLTKKTGISQQELQMWTCWNIQVRNEKNLLCCLRWREPSSLFFCYSFIWTECHALLPVSVISPRAWMEMCFWLSITFFMGGKSKPWSLLSRSFCQDVTGCNVDPMASKGHRRPWWRPRWRTKSGLCRHDDAVSFKCAQVRKKRPLRAADYNSKWFVFLKSVIDILSYQTYAGMLSWTILSLEVVGFQLSWILHSSVWKEWWDRFN